MIKFTQFFIHLSVVHWASPRYKSSAPSWGPNSTADSSLWYCPPFSHGMARALTGRAHGRAKGLASICFSWGGIRRSNGPGVWPGWPREVQQQNDSGTTWTTHTKRRNYLWTGFKFIYINYPDRKTRACVLLDLLLVLNASHSGHVHVYGRQNKIEVKRSIYLCSLYLVLVTGVLYHLVPSHRA